MNISRPVLLACSLASLLLLSAAALLGLERSEPALAGATAAAPRTGPVAPLPAASSQRDVARSAGYTAEPGTQLDYDLHLELGLALANSNGAAAAQPAPRVVLQFDGSLQLVVLGRRDDEVLVGYRTQGVRLAVQGSTEQATADWSLVLQRALQQGFDVRMDARGRPLAMRFLGEWTGEQRNFARGFVGAFRCEFQRSGTWASSFDDTMGHHVFESRAEPNGDDV
ncbi:MAG TPA: hypothetical protein VFZ65_22480, partial [Planctomycetota bacterium]|nr:hypothetical protein [Planctomycetota bacterium]